MRFSVAATANNQGTTVEPRGRARFHVRAGRRPVVASREHAGRADDRPERKSGRGDARFQGSPPRQGGALRQGIARQALKQRAFSDQIGVFGVDGSG